MAQIHWFSIVNSCVTVVLLTGFLATILMRVLKNEFLKYTKDEELAEEQEESGWKYLHGDVFRFPRPLSLFCAMLGTGTQFLVIAISIFFLAIFDIFYPYNRGALLTACVVSILLRYCSRFKLLSSECGLAIWHGICPTIQSGLQEFLAFFLVLLQYTSLTWFGDELYN